MSTHNIPLLDQYPGIVYRAKDGLLEDITSSYNKSDLKVDALQDTQESQEA